MPMPDGLSGVTGIAAGPYHSLALKNDGTVVAWGSDSSGQITVPAGTTGVIAIAASAANSIALRDATQDTAPIITIQPVSQSVPEIQSATFTVTANGGGPFTYQWRKNGLAISGATSAKLTLANLIFADAGDYDVVVSNHVGTVTSNVVTLTITPAVTVPSMPILYMATAITTNGFTARWGSVVGATSYHFDVSTNINFNSFVTGFQNLDVGNVTVFAVTGLNASTTYYFRVRAVNAVGASTSSWTGDATTAAPPPDVAPSIGSDTTTTFTVGVNCTYTLRASGYPAPTLGVSGQPSWVTFNSTSGVLSGTPPSGTGGSQFVFTVTASNGVSPDATQSFTLKVENPPAITTPLTITTLAGSAGSSGTTDGTGTAARFNSLAGVAADSTGNFYIADTNNHVIRKVTFTGVVTTLAGSAGTAGSSDGTGTAARFNFPSGLALDSSGNIYVADTSNHTIRKVTSAGVVTTIAGWPGTPDSADGAGTSARFYGPEGVALDSSGNLYVADTINNTIRKLVLATGAVTTIAGQAGVTGSTYGTGTAATFNGPSGITIDANGTLYLADSENNTIRTITANGFVGTLAGLAGSTGAADGTGSAARFNDPSAVVADSSGANVYVLDTDNHTVRKIATATGVVTTLAGSAGTLGSADGSGETARFNFPSGIAWTSTGLGIADTANHTVRVGQFPAAVAITAQPQSQTVTAGNNASFSVTATGRPAPTYQWRKDGADIAGATSSSYAITSAQTANAGNYTVTVSNAMGSVTSSTATLTVNPASTGGGGGGGGSSGGGGGGGGAPSVWFGLALALLAAARALRPPPRRH